MLGMGTALAIAAAQSQSVYVPPTDVKQPLAPPAQVESADSPEEIAKDAARDLKDSRFYNKPGATRAQYDADWQECRLIARGSRSPSGGYTYVYNPAVISPLAAGVGAGIGGAIGAAIVEGQIRRENRKSCLLVKGWRMIEPGEDEQKRIAAMTETEKLAFFDTVVGATEVKGGTVKWTNDFAAPKLAQESEQ
jgi:hypothetical protein